MIKILVATDLSERSAHAVQRAVPVSYTHLGWGRTVWAWDISEGMVESELLA